MLSTSSSRKLWALVDCNNFYASCEKLFRPDLADRPVVVLSNNDGCIVARSQEAKALGIPMGAPEFKVRDLLKEHQVEVFSSNYALYGDISNRVMSVLEELCPQVEQYSIDEAFLGIDGALIPNLPEFCRQIRETVRQWTGITVSIGVGKTRTLAKLANHVAKKHPELHGLYSLSRPEGQIDRVLAATPVGEIWGVGRRQRLKLLAEGIYTALDMKNADDIWLRKSLTVTGWHTALELRGIPCINTDESPPARRTIVSSRSFGKRVSDLQSLSEAVSSFTVRAAERLRDMELLAGGIAVHIRTSKHEGEVYDQTAQLSLSMPTDDSLMLLKAARQGLERIFEEGHPYAKAGIMLYDLQPKYGQQGSLLTLTTNTQSSHSNPLMKALDKVNARHGRHTLRYGAEGPDKAEWHMQQSRRSPLFTTDWNDLPKVQCS